jgi:hypothetical protein
MAEQRDRRNWQVASAVMALMANCNRDPKQHGPYRASDFDPYMRKANTVKAPISILKDVFINGRMPEVSQ